MLSSDAHVQVSQTEVREIAPGARGDCGGEVFEYKKHKNAPGLAAYPPWTASPWS